MRNKLLPRRLLAAIPLVLGICIGSAAAQTPHEAADNLSQAVEAIYQSHEEAMRDSLLQAVPADTSGVLASRRFESDLTEKYASDHQLNYERNNGKSILQQLKEWINALIRKLLGYGNEADNLAGTILDILYVIIFLAICFIVVRLVMNHKGRWFFEKRDENVPIDLNHLERHIHEVDFHSLLEEAEQADNTRQSVRLLYLWTLKSLADREIIEWNPDKTNIDYLADIKDGQLKSDFGYLSYLYNYIWYGEFSINSSEYQLAREKFRKHIV